MEKVWIDIWNSLPMGIAKQEIVKRALRDYHRIMMTGHDKCLLDVSFTYAKHWIENRCSQLSEGVRVGAFNEESVEVVNALNASLKLNDLDGCQIVEFPDAKPAHSIRVQDANASVAKDDQSGSLAATIKPRKRRKRKHEVEIKVLTEADKKMMERQKKAKKAMEEIGIFGAPDEVEGRRCSVCKMSFKQKIENVEHQHQFIGKGVHFCPFGDDPEIIIEYNPKKSEMRKANDKRRRDKIKDKKE